MKPAVHSENTNQTGFDAAEYVRFELRLKMITNNGALH